jgi:hypothetical protein
MDCHCVLKHPVDKKDKVDVYIYQPKTKTMEKIKKTNKNHK